MLQIPSFANLAAFIAVGKRKSFRKAAEDMMLTPGAISQKIKQLESQLDCKLLHRSSRGVSFTEKGERYFIAITPLVSDLADITQEFFGKPLKRSIIVSVMPAFALRWLIPRLDSFHQQFPDLIVSINATDRLVEFEADNVDMAIRHGLGCYPKLRAERLFSENLVPVCSPKLLRKATSLNEIRDLNNYTLLHDKIAKDWFLFLSALGEDNVDHETGPRFDNDSLMIQSAIEGHGVALARTSLVEREIKNGDLVVPFDHRIPSQFAYYVVYPKSSSVLPEIKLFRDWLLHQAKEYLPNS